MQRLRLGENLDTFRALQSAYSERHRHYHTAEHINTCLAIFAKARHLAREPDEVELALWFHDAIYRTRSQDNEAKSAQWARDFLEAGGVEAGRRDRVHDLILATTHAVSVHDADAALLVDVDLSILGADAQTYDRFERDVRKEYWWVPGPRFRHTRAKILQSFLDRPSVYATAHFQDRLEQAARQNLGRAITALRPEP